MTEKTGAEGNFAHLVSRWEALSQTPGGVPQDAGMSWLKDALSAAIKLEFSTIPPYLCALWSIEDQSTPVALSIRSIVQEEMLHMALACNMLVAIGGTPRIADPAFAPTYPGKLAGGVHKDLTVRLSALNKKVLEDFLVIELPERESAFETEKLKQATDLPELQNHDSTIGELYDLLVTAFDTLKPMFSTDRQISGPLSWFPVRNLEEVAKAVDLIKHQGEGSAASPTESEDGEGGAELAHFYRFLEIWRGQKITKTEDGLWGFGDEIEEVKVFPMAEVPPGGYAADTVPEDVRRLLDAFDERYTRLLNQLDDLWRRGDQGQLVHAIETMFSLQEPARALMQIPITRGEPATYGPCFRFKAEAMPVVERRPIETRFLFRITIETDFDAGRIRTVKNSPWGELVNVAVVGGAVKGPAVTGRVLDMGGDWGKRRDDETAEGTLAVTELDCTLMIETADAEPALIEMTYGGVSYRTGDGKSYFRTTPRFRTGDPRYAFLNRVVAVANGTHRHQAGPVYDVYEVL